MKISKGIIIIPSMGFANRLRFIACAKLSLSFLSKNFFIDWQKCSGFNCNYNKIFEKIKDISMINRKDYLDSNYLFFGYVHLSKIIEMINNDKDKEYEYLVVTGGHQIIPKSEQIFKWIKNKQNFYKSIYWNKDIENRIGIFTKKNNIDFKNTIAIHIRYIQEDFDRKDIKHNSFLDFNLNSPIEKFIEYIKLVDSSKEIILFTNSNYVKYKIKQISSQVTCRIIIFSNNFYNRLSTNNILDSILEFNIMSRCKMIIGSYLSSFSDEASYINNIPKLIVLSDTIKNNKDKLKKFSESYHSSNVEYIFNNLCINSNSQTILSCFTNLS